MEVIELIRDYWVLITFACGVISAFFAFLFAMIQAVKCSLRNDILDIYDRCNEKHKITRWQLESIEHSFKLYKMLKGNSFIKDLVEKVREFEVID